MDGFSFPFCEFFKKNFSEYLYSRSQQIMTYGLAIIIPRNSLNMEQDRGLRNMVDTNMS